MRRRLGMATIVLAKSAWAKVKDGASDVTARRCPIAPGVLPGHS
jgi:hypothetical protein